MAILIDERTATITLWSMGLPRGRYLEQAGEREQVSHHCVSSYPGHYIEFY
jgi:hypothetical protein